MASRWTNRKPQTGTRVEFDRGYAREHGLVGAWILNETHPRDLSEIGNHARPADSTGFNAPTARVRATPHGAGYDFNANTGRHRLTLGTIGPDNPLNLVADSDTQNRATVVFRALKETGQSNDFGRIIDVSTGTNGTDGWGVGADSRASPNAKWVFFKEALAGSSDADMFQFSTYQNVAITFEATEADELNFYLDGAHYSANGHGSPNTFETTSKTGAIGHWNHNNTDRSWCGMIDYVYVFNRLVPAREIARLALTPYCYLRPVRARTFFLAPAPPVGGGFNAWYAGGTQVAV